MGKEYGFCKETYDNGVEIETLVTGDGKAQFTDIKYSDGTVAIGIAYGAGSGVGTSEFIGRKVDEQMLIKWQVKFDNQVSIDAMIKALLEAKNRLAEQ